MTQVWTSWTLCEWREIKFYWASHGIGVHAAPPDSNPLKRKNLWLVTVAINVEGSSFPAVSGAWRSQGQSSQVAGLLTTQLSRRLLGPGSWHTKHFRSSGGDLGKIVLKAEKQAKVTGADTYQCLMCATFHARGFNPCCLICHWKMATDKWQGLRQRGLG